MTIVDLGIPLAVRSELAVRGVRTDTAVRRGPGAGPSDDGHLALDGANAALRIDPGSPYVIRDGRIYDTGVGDTGSGDTTGAGDRDMGVAVKSKTLAAFFTKVLRADMKLETDAEKAARGEAAS